MVDEPGIANGAEINLSTLQKTLDGTALELVENLVGRKKLAESTRGALLAPT